MGKIEARSRRLFGSDIDAGAGDEENLDRKGLG